MCLVYMWVYVCFRLVRGFACCVQCVHMCFARVNMLYPQKYPYPLGWIFFPSSQWKGITRQDVQRRHMNHKSLRWKEGCLGDYLVTKATDLYWQGNYSFVSIHTKITGHLPPAQIYSCSLDPRQDVILYDYIIFTSLVLLLKLVIKRLGGKCNVCATAYAAGTPTLPPPSMCVCSLHT